MRCPAAALPLLLALLPGAAWAQPRVAAGPARPVEVRRAGAETPFRALMGVPVAQRLLQADDVAARIRGAERLGAIGTPEAVDALVETLGGSALVLWDPRVRLAAVRALAGETKRDAVRQLLLREVTDAGGVSPLAGLLRTTAALALARGGDRKAVAALVATLLRPGPPADAAAIALQAYPPESLDALVEGHRPSPAEQAPGIEGRKRLSAPIAAFLGEAGDMRAIERLRALLAEGDPPARAVAALALARLGDEAALPAAREWAKKGDPHLKLTAAEVLVALDAPDASAAVAELLEHDATRDDGIRLALRAPAPSLAGRLAHVLPGLEPDARARAIAAIGRAGGVRELASLLDAPETATEAAFALATMPGDEARAALGAALAGEGAKKGDARRLLVRAATVRALVLDDPPAGLRAMLRALREEKDPADRAAATFGLVATGALSVGDAVAAACPREGCDAVLVGAAARGALALPDGASSLDPLLPILLRAAAPGQLPPAGGEALAIAAGAALLAHGGDGGGELPTSLLALWAESGGPLSPLAARALPARDDEAVRGRIKRLLEGSDPVVRAHVALGLGRDPEPSAVTLLTGAYRFEEDANVRRAVVRALSMRSEVQRLATLATARDLDPDAGVRSLAAAALAGRAAAPALRPALGVEPRRSVAWITIRATDGEARDAPPRAARLTRSDGLAVPALADPDGVMLVPGLPAGPASLQLARP